MFQKMEGRGALRTELNSLQHFLIYSSGSNLGEFHKMGFLPFLIYYYLAYLSTYSLACNFRVPSSCSKYFPPPSLLVNPHYFQKVVFSIFKTPILELNFYHRL